MNTVIRMLCLKKLRKQTIFNINTYFLIRTTYVEFQTATTIIPLVGIETDYGLDCLGSNPDGDQIFCPFELAPWSTQPPVKWVPGLPGSKVQPGRAADHSPPSSAVVTEEHSTHSTHHLGHIGPVTGTLYITAIMPQGNLTSDRAMKYNEDCSRSQFPYGIFTI